MGQTVSACSGQSQANVLTIFKGTCNDYPCSVLRDAGSSCIGICRKFIKPIDYTGNKAKCMMFNGQVVELETAYATIHTPFYSGKVICFVLDNAVADVIVGNIEGVPDPFKANSQNYSDRDDSDYSRKLPDAGNAVTRANTRQARADTNESATSDIQQLNEVVHDSVTDIQELSEHTFRLEQQNDASLNDIRYQAFQGDSYVIKNGLIYRKSRRNNSND